MDIKIGDRVLTLEGTGFVVSLPKAAHDGQAEVAVSLDRPRWPGGGELKLVGVETVTGVFSGGAFVSISGTHTPRDLERLKDFLRRQPVVDEKPVGRPTKVPFLRIIK